MDMRQESFDRIVFFEQARQIAEAHYAMNPLDAENLTKWGGALLELSQFQNGPDCMEMLTEAVSKLEEALVVSPRKHDTLWCLGNARTSQAFLTTNEEEARTHFTKATECFQKALQEDPGNELYLKSLELVAKFCQVPDLQSEFHAAGGYSASTTEKSKEKKSNELKYDICGWIILAVGIVVWVGMVKSHVPPPPPV